MKAFLFALDQGPEQQVKGTSTPFLLLEGRPLLLFVLVALDRVRDIDQITIVGPQKKIMQVLEMSLLSGLLFSKKVLVQEQKEGLVENFLSASESSPQKDREEKDPLKLVPSDRPALFLPGDIPLVTTAEIETFIAGSDTGKYDVTMGITSEASLRPFYSDENQPGIKKSYFALKGATFRFNNLYLFRPQQMAQRIIHQKSKEDRQSIANDPPEDHKKEDWSRALPFYISDLIDTSLNQTVRNKIDACFQKEMSLEQLEKSLLYTMNLKIKFIERWKGAGALNIDDRSSYEAISARINDWRNYLAGLNQNKEGELLCPISGDTCQSE